MEAERTGGLGRIRGAHPATLAFWLGVVISIGVWIVVGRRQWFIRDDWAFLLTREKMRILLGYDHMLLEPQDGHWMTTAILVFRFLRWSFGIDSYTPYLAVLLASHLGVVLLTRALCRRVGVSPWMTTLMCGVLLVFGFGWENLLFAVQITYTFSLIAFLAQLLLADHDGPVDRRDVIGAGIGGLGVMSSGFGPFYIFGIGLLLALRRRWKALLVAVVPQGLAYVYWWVAWGADPAADRAGRRPGLVPRFTGRGMMETFAALTGSRWLAGGAAVLVVGIIVWRRVDGRTRSMLITLLATAVVMFAGIGLERAGIGLEFATQSRYVYMAAVLIAPILALGLDQAGRFAPWAVWAPRLLMVLAIGRNTVALRENGDAWAARAQEERRLIALIAGSGRIPEADQNASPLPYTPDVHVSDIATLVAGRAVTPRPPANSDEELVVAMALGLPLPP